MINFDSFPLFNQTVLYLAFCPVTVMENVSTFEQNYDR